MILAEHEVNDWKTLYEFTRQRVGCGGATQNDMKILRKKIKDFFAQFPSADWETLTKCVQWTRDHRKRPDRVWRVIDWHREAYADGYLPELDPTHQDDAELDKELLSAIDRETNQSWRRKLMTAKTGNRVTKCRVIEDWQKARL